MTLATETTGLPRLIEQGRREQRALAQAPFHRWVFADGTLWALFYREAAGYLLRFPGLADFEVSADGLDVRGWTAPGLGSATVQNLYLNQVLPLALSRQGKLVLHASAVDLAGSCVAFVGISGRGKSTLAASFATAGTRFLTDDGLQLEWRQGRLTVLPSHPSIRLWADSQTALIGDTTPVAPAADYTPKARFLAGNALAFCDQPMPLGAVYFLGDGEATVVKIEPMKAATALLELVRHSFLLDIDERDMLALHFEEISRIANLPIHYHLDYPRRFDELPNVRRALVAHIKDRVE
jgi:hypothetical protein